MNATWAFLKRFPVMASLLMSITLVACASSRVPSAPTEVPSAPSDVAYVPSELLASGEARLAGNAPGDDVKALVTGNNAFAFDLYQAISGGEDNLLYSPFSISQVLAMVYAGARGDTAQQMADTLHFTLPQERLHAAFNALDSELASRSSAPSKDESGKEEAAVAFQLHTANAVWAQKGYPFRTTYLAVLAQNYGSGVHVADFKTDPGAAAQEINDWVSQETEKRIPKIVGDLSPNTKLVLANAIYFKAVWELVFRGENTDKEPFHLLTGQEERAPMMHQSNRLLYAEGDEYQAIELFYRNQGAAMVILLPGEGRFREIEQRLTGEWVQDVVSGLSWQHTVILTMPKFTYAPDLPLTKILPAMGMPVAFSGDADFSGMLEAGQYRIADVLHKGFIDVNELGTEAAAATISIIVEKGIEQNPPPPIVMKIDRPFIYIIRDVKTNAILFVGRVMKPVP